MEERCGGEKTRRRNRERSGLLYRPLLGIDRGLIEDTVYDSLFLSRSYRLNNLKLFSFIDYRLYITKTIGLDRAQTA